MNVDYWSSRLFAVKPLVGHHGNYTLRIQAQDRGTPANIALQEMEICVSDFNDHSPRFVWPQQNTTLKVFENTTVGLNHWLEINRNRSYLEFTTVNDCWLIGGVSNRRRVSRWRRRGSQQSNSLYDPSGSGWSPQVVSYRQCHWSTDTGSTPRSWEAKVLSGILANWSDWFTTLSKSI